MNKTQAQIEAERAWRETLMYFIGYRSSFNVKDIADRLTSIEFNKDGDMIERGRAYGYLKKHFPSLFPVWRVRVQRILEEENGKDKTTIHTRHTKGVDTKPSGGSRGNGRDSKRKDSKSTQKSPRPKHSATVHSG